MPKYRIIEKHGAFWPQVPFLKFFWRRCLVRRWSDFDSAYSYTAVHASAEKAIEAVREFYTEREKRTAQINSTGCM